VTTSAETDEYIYEEQRDEYMDDGIRVHSTRQYEYIVRDNTSTCTRNIVTSAWTIDNTRNIVTIQINSIHEQSECYTCKQYECNEYVRSALARSN
jgi:hypothetical protein